MHHTEKFAAMGLAQHIRHKIAAFLGNTVHESDDFEAAQEYLVLAGEAGILLKRWQCNGGILFPCPARGAL